MFYFTSSWPLFLMASVSAFHLYENEYKELTTILEFCSRLVRGIEIWTVHITWEKECSNSALIFLIVQLKINLNECITWLLCVMAKVGKIDSKGLLFLYYMLL